MSEAYEITVETSDTKGFWTSMGPFFASRALAKELGGSLFNDEGMLWVIARSHGHVVGWAACIAKDEKGLLEWSWVHADHRRKGLWRRLHKVRVKHLKASGVTVIRTSTREKDMVKALESEGLKKIGSRGSWVQMEQVL